jgi:hypothetical protein
MLDSGTRDDRDRRQGVALEAHRRSDDTFGRSAGKAVVDIRSRSATRARSSSFPGRFW